MFAYLTFFFSATVDSSVTNSLDGLWLVSLLLLIASLQATGLG